MNDYNIKQGSTLHLLLSLIDTSSSSFSINIRTLTGKNFNLMVGKYDTIKRVKQLLQHKEGIPSEQIRLIFRAKQFRR